MEYTILEAAQELGYTKNAIKYHVSKLPMEDTRKENGVIYITQTGFEKIKSRIGSNHQTTTNNRQITTQEPPNNHEKADNNRQTTTQQSDKSNDILLYDALMKTVAALENQLTVKDRQLSERDAQITSLTAALQAAQQTAAAAQALHAGTIQVQREALTAAQTEAETATTENKRSLLYRLTHRKK